jgi:hypothetical protein
VIQHLLRDLAWFRELGVNAELFEGTDDRVFLAQQSKRLVPVLVFLEKDPALTADNCLTTTEDKTRPGSVKCIEG